MQDIQMSDTELQDLEIFTSSMSLTHLTLRFLVHLWNKKLLRHLNIPHDTIQLS